LGRGHGIHRTGICGGEFWLTNSFSNHSYGNYSYEMSASLRKPDDMFDRDFEWAQLVRFAADAGPDPTWPHTWAHLPR
jgi:hypothetical protein